MTTTTGCGSGEFVGDTGIHLNNMMGEEDLLPVEHVLRPGERLTSMMAPSVLLDDGRPILATGSAGSNRLRGAILQPLLRVLESGRAGRRGARCSSRLDRAVQAPRLHAEGGRRAGRAGLLRGGARPSSSGAGTSSTAGPARTCSSAAPTWSPSTTDGSFAAAGDHRRGGGAFIALADGSVRRA